MPIIPKMLGQAALTAVDQTVYTAPAGTAATIRTMRVCNTTASDRTVTIYLLPSAGSPADGNAIIKNAVVPASGWLNDDSIHVREAGGRVIAHADAVGLTLTLSGAESTPEV